MHAKYIIKGNEILISTENFGNSGYSPKNKGNRGWGVIVKDQKTVNQFTDIFFDDLLNSIPFNCNSDFNISLDQTHYISNNYFIKKFKLPDLKIIIDLPVYEGYGRKNDGTPLSYLELRQKYYNRIYDNNTLHLNGLEPIGKLASQIKKWVLKNI